MRAELNSYRFRPAEELEVEGEEAAPAAAPPEPEPEMEPEPAEWTEPEPAQLDQEQELHKSPIDFARIQAEAIMADARREAEEYKEASRLAFDQELEELQKRARDEAYARGYAEGMADAMKEGQIQREQMAAEQSRQVQEFLQEAVYLRDRILDDSKEELKELALSIAEKVIRVSLRGSGDILRRMVEAATEKHKRCEWAHIYIADCDVKGAANTIPELTAALRNLSSRVRVTPMADDESGTCIVEMPDVILDASVSTQLNSIREVLANTPLDEGGG